MLPFRRFIHGALLCAMAGSAACGTEPTVEGPEILPGLTVPPTPANGIQIISPIFHDILPAHDYEICTWSDVVVDKVTDVRMVQGYQNEPPGHHIVVFYTMEKQPPGTQRICQDADMASFRFVAGTDGGGAQAMAPANLVYRIPAGAQIVLNHHYLNATDETMQGQSIVNLTYADPGNYIPSNNLAIVDSGLVVGQGHTTQKMHATFDSALKLWYMIPHMHRWGSNIKVNLTQGQTTTTLFDVQWEEGFTFHPPNKTYDPATPLQIVPGDSMDIECSWNNNEGRDLVFGFEMCVVFGQFVDDKGVGNRSWDNGTWGPF
jgi:hypothetical protein